jgi:proteasome accessory factor B
MRYRIPGTYFLPPTNFTPEEALALLVLCHELGGSAGPPFMAPARSAAVKLESSLPGRLREHLRSFSRTIQIRQQPRNPLTGQESVFETLLRASANHRCVRIRYDSATEQTEICTKLSPYQLLFSRRSWYVIGRSSIHRSVRTFNVGRIRSLELLEDGFEVPRGFSVERYLGNAWHMIPERGPDYRVHLRFSKMVAKNVAEVVWHKTQQIRHNPDGTLDFTATVSGLGEISWWILGYGDQVEVLQPPKLRELIAQRIANMAQIYGLGPRCPKHDAAAQADAGHFGQ